MDRPEVTRLLEGLAGGSDSAASQLLPLVYEELRRLARTYLKKERRDHTLQATALVNEVCVRLLGSGSLSWESRAHFLAIASRAMRRVLSTYARDRRAAKRTPNGYRVTLSDVPKRQDGVDILELDEALTALANLDAQDAAMVELRHFGGLNIEEISLVLGVPKRTLERRLRAAEAWLATQLGDGHGRSRRSGS